MSISHLEIREVRYDLPAARALIDAVQDYYNSIYNGPDESPVDPAEFAAPSGKFFLGYEAGTPVAMGGWRWVEPMAGLDAVRPAEIKRMYVDPAARGRGYARSILRHLEDTAMQAGADAIILSTGQPQRAAIALYRSAGYQDIASFGYYAAYDTAVHLGKHLYEAAVSEPPPDGTAR